MVLSRFVDGYGSDTSSDSEPEHMPTSNGDVEPVHVDCDSSKASDQEPGASSNTAPRCNRGNPIPIGVYNGDDDDSDGDYEYHHDPQPYDLPATENSADSCTKPAPTANQPYPEDKHRVQTRMIINLGDSSPGHESPRATRRCRQMHRWTRPCTSLQSLRLPSTSRALATRSARMSATS